jgi:hypothetical protein
MLFSGTGVSREEASGSTLKFAVCLSMPSRLKPVPLKAYGVPVGPASAGKRPAVALSICSVPIDAFPAKAGPTNNLRCTRRKSPAVVLSVCSVPIDAFPAKAGPTKSIRCTRRTGFSREEAGLHTFIIAV